MVESNDSPSDETLVAEMRRAAPGDTQAFEILVRRHQRRVLANCRHLTNAQNDAEDLAQEVFVKAYFALERFEGRSSFKTWLTRVKTNHCLNYLRRQSGVRYVDLDDGDEDGHAEYLRQDPVALRDLERRDEQTMIAMALDALSDTLRVPLVLREVDGLSYEDVAEALGIQLSAAKMRIKRARAHFREVFTALQAAPESIG